MSTVAALDRCGTRNRIGLRRALSAVLRGRCSLPVAARRFGVALEALRPLVKAGRMPW